MSLAYRIMRWVCRFLLGARARLVFEGREHLPDGPFIIVSNHVSNWDPVALGLLLWDRQMRALGKQELFELPLLGKLALACGGIPIRRGEPDREALSQCKAALQSGQPLLVLPEGTRSRSGTLSEGKLGVIFLAQLTNVPIVPAAVLGTRQVGWPWRRSLIRVRIGRPFTIDRSARRPEQRQAQLNRTMHAIAELLPYELRGAYADSQLSAGT
jgi:1-acyl-sn-glycerol-3-phosphate acyltransferase